MKCEYDCTDKDCNQLREHGKCAVACNALKYVEEDIMEHSMMTMGPDNMVTIKVDRISHLGVIYPRTEVHYRWKISTWGIGGATSVLVNEYLRMMNDDNTEVA